MKAPVVYILASQRNGTLYIGVTSDLIQRIWQHREGVVEGFTQQHAVKTLVWYEQHDTMESAITREKALKKWNRDWKIRLIQKTNPNWLDLWADITGQTKDEPQSPIPSSPPAPAPSSPPAPAPSSPNAFVGDPAPTLVQGRFNARNEQSGFPPKACGNDGNKRGGL